MTTHDYTKRYWSHDYTINTIKDRGNEIHMMGWGRGIKDGDYLLLQNGVGTTRYLVNGIEYFSDPPDMWKVVAVFEPRAIAAEL